MSASKARRTAWRAEVVLVFVDASVQSAGVGLGVAYKDRFGRLIGWRSKLIRTMTSVEAEYEALIYALEQVRGYAPMSLCVFSDNQVVMAQMAGTMRVNHDSLKRLYQRAKSLEQHFDRVTYAHIPREFNVLADAMAEEAVLRAQIDTWLVERIHSLPIGPRQPSRSSDAMRAHSSSSATTSRTTGGASK